MHAIFILSTLLSAPPSPPLAACMPLEADSACESLTGSAPVPPTRAIVFTATTAGCEPVSGPIFDVGTSSVSIDYLFGRRALEVPPGQPPAPPSNTRLNAYCTLDLVNGSWPSEAQLQAAVQGLGGAFTNSTVKYDYRALVPGHPASGDRYPYDLANYHRNRFLHAVGAIDVDPNVITIPNANNLPRIAILDTASTYSNPGWTVSYPDGYGGHGITLARIAETLLCRNDNPLGHCLAEVVSYQIFKPDPAGRPKGALGALASAIVEAVDEAQGKRLIINVSAAWVNKVMGGKYADPFVCNEEPPGSAAVHEALQYARCRGASIVVAAGNRLGDEDNCYEDKAWPAEWHSHLVDSTLCWTEFGVDAPGLTVPLLTSVGAVNDGGAYAALRRELSDPDVFANGIEGTAYAWSGNSAHPTAVMSGTSVSTIVASSLIAAHAAVSGRSPVNAEMDVRGWVGPPRSPPDPVLAPTTPLNFVDFFLSTGNALPARVPSPPAFPPINQSSSFYIGVQPTLSCYGHQVRTTVNTCDALGLQYSSTDEDPQVKETPLPGGGCFPCLLFDEGSMQVMLNLDSPTGYVASHLVVTDNTGTETHFDLPAVSLSGLSFVDLQGFSLSDPSLSTAKIYFMDSNHPPTMSAIEIYLAPSSPGTGSPPSH